MSRDAGKSGFRHHDHNRSIWLLPVSFEGSNTTWPNFLTRFPIIVVSNEWYNMSGCDRVVTLLSLEKSVHATSAITVHPSRCWVGCETPIMDWAICCGCNFFSETTRCCLFFHANHQNSVHWMISVRSCSDEWIKMNDDDDGLRFRYSPLNTMSCYYVMMILRTWRHDILRHTRSGTMGKHSFLMVRARVLVPFLSFFLFFFSLINNHLPPNRR